MPRQRRSSGRERPEPNLIPMLDIVLQLITFFMMLVYFGTRIEGATGDVRLPTAPTALPRADLALERLAVAIDPEGRLLVGDEAREGPDTQQWWADEARQRRQAMSLLGGAATELPTLVVIRADRGVPYGVVRRTLQTAQSQGFSRFTLVVLRERGS